MKTTEFSLIDQYFKNRTWHRDDVLLGIGDDAAVTRVPPDFDLLSAVDTLVEGVHFPADTAPFDIGFKALAVNLSDLAAMGAEPAWATLALTLPDINESWLQSFSDGFFSLAQRYNVQLIGGDTTQGPLSITVQVMGLSRQDRALTRAGASAGDRVMLSGCVGDAALALRMLHGGIEPQVTVASERRQLLDRLNRPMPRIELGLALRGIASAAIDVSDGLAADLGHILAASNTGATLQLDKVPVSDTLRRLGSPLFEALAMGGGDDYELCFTVPGEKLAELEKVRRQLKINVTEIGEIDKQQGLRVQRDGVSIEINQPGYQHFSQS